MADDETDDPEFKEPKRKVPPGWYPDAHDPSQEQYWDGDRWTDARRPMATEPEQPQGSTAEKKSSAFPWVIGVIVVLLIIGAISGGGEDDDTGDGGGSSSSSGPEFTEAKVVGRCPTRMIAGLTDYATFRVTPNEDWPSAYVTVFDGQDLVDAASLNGAPGKERGLSLETYELAGGIDKNKTETIKLAMLGVDAEKTELSVQVFGGRPGRQSPPSDLDAIYRCDVVVVG